LRQVRAISDRSSTQRESRKVVQHTSYLMTQFHPILITRRLSIKNAHRFMLRSSRASYSWAEYRGIIPCAKQFLIVKASEKSFHDMDFLKNALHCRLLEMGSRGQAELSQRVCPFVHYCSTGTMYQNAVGRKPLFSWLRAAWR